MKTLAIDIETFSDIDLVKCGVYNYTESPNFEIILFAYAFDSEEVKIVDLLAGEKIPTEVISAIKSEKIIKTAFNAQFERVCLSKHLGLKLLASSWQCTAVQSAMLGLPLSLDGVGMVLNLEEKKMKEGKELIRYFSIPAKPSKSNGERTRNLPIHAPEKWDKFKDYCKRDVEVEKAIREKLKKYPISIREQELYILDQRINDRGILVDLHLARNAIQCDTAYRDIAISESKRISGLENPNSVAQIKEWLSDQGHEVESLSKKAVQEMIQETEGSVERFLELRTKLSKTSIKKYEAIKRSVCKDKRVRGLLQFYGANRTGRWAGRLVQVQNLPQNHLKDLELARKLLREDRFEDLELLFDSVPNLLSELIRTAFIPKVGCSFIVADFSAIEARVIAWLAGETWRMNVFSSHGKIYEASASQMFKVPIEEVTKGSQLRQKGKISELALGYGGSVGALKSMGALEMGLQEEELQPLVNTWRNANPNITRLWWEIDRAAIQVVKEKGMQQVGKIKIQCKSGILFITLPSGRNLCYIKPRLEENKFGREGITYEGVAENKRWGRIETYGPKLVENIVQGIARDLLAEALINVDRAGYDIVMHVHDEIVVEAVGSEENLNEVCRLMAVAPSWAKGLPLRADGFICDFYKKD
ncbi:MAG: DNA polymerase [Candidatus Syntrophosphaera sp.]|nr:DNA polymerase [Candidatus Syntrophosphaera sp.]